MRVAVDANVLAAALVRPGGWTASQLRRPVTWVAPAVIRAELAEHAASFAQKAGVDEVAWRARVADLLARLDLVPTSRLAAWRRHGIVRRVAAADADDWPYAALLVGGEAQLLWTRDAALLRLLPGLAVEVVPMAAGEG